MSRALLCVVIVLSVASWACGDQLILNFTEPTSRRSSIFGDMQNSNTGGNGMEVIGPPAGYHMDGLLWVNLSALTGATINSATFHVAQDGWGWAGLAGVELRRFTSTQTWTQGDGHWSDRWDNDNGTGARLADWYEEGGTGTGHRWDGVLVNWLDGQAPYNNYIGAFVYDCDTIPAGTAGVDFDMKLLVQQWANGTYPNNGWVMWAENSLSTTSAHLQRPTLTIDFTPAAIPEPGTMFLLGGGAAVLLHWRRRHLSGR